VRRYTNSMPIECMLQITRICIGEVKRAYAFLLETY